MHEVDFVSQELLQMKNLHELPDCLTTNTNIYKSFIAWISAKLQVFSYVVLHCVVWHCIALHRVARVVT